MQHITKSRKATKWFILDWCMEQFQKKDIWLIDSLQIFDPYYLARKDKDKARQLLNTIRIARPFTIYQLRDKVFSLTRIHLAGAAIIISSIDCFKEEVRKKEWESIEKKMVKILEGLEEGGSDIIIGHGGKAMG